MPKPPPHKSPIENIGLLTDVPTAPEDKDVELREDLETERLTYERYVAPEFLRAELENDQLKADTEHLRAVTEMRRDYALKAFFFLCTWAIVVFVIILLQGFKTLGFALSDTVLTVLVGTTTVSVIGLLGFVLRGLFRSYQPPKDSALRKR